ncbi:MULTISPECIES: hypothetical protein [unclassified Moorena]|nr:MULTISPECIES: hypothetical protein [unclassified Moorena]
MIAFIDWVRDLLGVGSRESGVGSRECQSRFTHLVISLLLIKP